MKCTHLAFGGFAAVLLALSAAPATAQPHAALQDRGLKALSPDQVADLLAGRGLALALGAELIGYRGPRHVLEHHAGFDWPEERRSGTEEGHDGLLKLRRAAENWDVPVVVTSAATGQGLDDLRSELFRRVPDLPTAPLDELADVEALAEHQVFRPAGDRGFEIEQVGPHAFRVTGRRVEHLLQRFDVENEEAADHVERRLHRIGVVQALEDAGFEPGDELEIAGVELELDPTA